MSRNGDTYLAVKARQWVGGRLAFSSSALMGVAAAVAASGVAASDASTTSEIPLLLWVGILATLVSSPNYTPGDAINVAQGHGRVGVRRTAQDREAARNMKRQLHARGRAGLFLRSVYVRLGFGFVGSVLVLVTVVLASDITTSGITASGWLPVVCLVGSLIALMGLLLAVPFRNRNYVVIDVWGNVRGTDEPVDPSQTATRN